MLHANFVKRASYITLAILGFVAGALTYPTAHNGDESTVKKPQQDIITKPVNTSRKGKSSIKENENMNLHDWQKRISVNLIEFPQFLLALANQQELGLDCLHCIDELILRHPSIGEPMITDAFLIFLSKYSGNINNLPPLSRRSQLILSSRVRSYAENSKWLHEELCDITELKSSEGLSAGGIARLHASGIDVSRSVELMMTNGSLTTSTLKNILDPLATSAQVRRFASLYLKNIGPGTNLQSAIDLKLSSLHGRASPSDKQLTRPNDLQVAVNLLHTGDENTSGGAFLSLLSNPKLSDVFISNTARSFLNTENAFRTFSKICEEDLPISASLSGTLAKLIPVEQQEQLLRQFPASQSAKQFREQAAAYQTMKVDPEKYLRILADSGKAVSAPIIDVWIQSDLADSPKLTLGLLNHASNPELYSRTIAEAIDTSLTTATGIQDLLETFSSINNKLYANVLEKQIVMKLSETDAVAALEFMQQNTHKLPSE